MVNRRTPDSHLTHSLTCMTMNLQVGDIALIDDSWSSDQHAAEHFTSDEKEASKVELFIIPDKCKVMITRTNIQASGADQELTSYFNSYISHNGRYENDVRVRNGKAAIPVRR